MQTGRGPNFNLCSPRAANSTVRLDMASWLTCSYPRWNPALSQRMRTRPESVHSAFSTLWHATPTRTTTKPPGSPISTCQGSDDRPFHQRAPHRPPHRSRLARRHRRQKRRRRRRRRQRQKRLQRRPASAPRRVSRGRLQTEPMQKIIPCRPPLNPRSVTGGQLIERRRNRRGACAGAGK